MTITLDEAIKISTRRLQKARVRMLIASDPATGKNPFVFWATAAMHLRMRPVAGLAQVTRGHIGTNGDEILFDPFVYANPDKSDANIISDIGHETSHCVKGDIWRRGSRDALQWNIACDMRIDPELIKYGFEGPDHGSPEANALFHNMANYGRSAEEIYRERQQEQEQQQGQGQQPGDSGDGQGQGQGPGTDPLGGDVLDPTQADPTDPTSGIKDPAEAQRILEELGRKWEVIGRQAAEMAKAQGTLPLGYEHLIKPVKPALNPWDLIRQYVTMCRKDDWSWARPNRRSIHRGIGLPSLHSEGIGTLLIGMDTSGSCADAIPTFLGFLALILSEVKPERTIFMDCDCTIHKVREFTAYDELPDTVPASGYGGTSMAPLWDKCEEMQLDPICAIVLTDCLMGPSDFGQPQTFPVLWLSSDAGRSAPWGDYAELPH